jgi:alkylation response protein AidB-like acyl-CoA dehydrogenase
MKIQGATMAMDVASQAIQIFGGLGVVKETGVERFWRDAKVMCIGGASIDALKDDIAGMLKQGIEFN